MQRYCVRNISHKNEIGWQMTNKYFNNLDDATDYRIGLHNADAFEIISIDCVHPFVIHDDGKVIDILPNMYQDSDFLETIKSLKIGNVFVEVNMVDPVSDDINCTLDLTAELAFYFDLTLYVNNFACKEGAMQSRHFFGTDFILNNSHIVRTKGKFRAYDKYKDFPGTIFELNKKYSENYYSLLSMFKNFLSDGILPWDSYTKVDPSKYVEVWLRK
jgi:hypothetical protein